MQTPCTCTPGQAALFFVPVMVMQMVSNLWHPYTYLEEVRDHLRSAYPYWNRSQGADHVFFLTTDRAGCWKPHAIKESIILTTLGFPAPEAYFGFEQRLRWPRQGPQRRNNAYDTRRGSPATELDCYVPGKDVVVPVDAIVGPAELSKLPRPGATFACRPPRQAKTLLFMGGAMSNMGRIEYSQGVRQATAPTQQGAAALCSRDDRPHAAMAAALCSCGCDPVQQALSRLLVSAHRRSTGSTPITATSCWAAPSPTTICATASSASRPRAGAGAGGSR